MERGTGNMKYGITRHTSHDTRNSYPCTPPHFHAHVRMRVIRAPRLSSPSPSPRPVILMSAGSQPCRAVPCLAFPFLSLPDTDEGTARGNPQSPAAVPRCVVDLPHPPISLVECQVDMTVGRLVGSHGWRARNANVQWTCQTAWKALTYHDITCPSHSH